MLSENDTTEKQAMSAAAILTADNLITTNIFNETKCLTVEEIAPFLQTKAAVSMHERAYEQLCEYIIQNSYCFKEDSSRDTTWGKFSEDNKTVYIVKREYDRMCNDEGFNGRALLSWLVRSGKAERSGEHLTKKVRINGKPVNAVALKLQDGFTDEENTDFDEQKIFENTV